MLTIGLLLFLVAAIPVPFTQSQLQLQYEDAISSIVYITNKEVNLSCIGAILGKNWVITTGTCITTSGMNVTEATVHAGPSPANDESQITSKSFHQTRNVSTYSLYPYRETIPWFDIALIRIKGNFTFDFETTSPAILANAQFPRKFTSCQVFRWIDGGTAKTKVLDRWPVRAATGSTCSDYKKLFPEFVICSQVVTLDGGCDDDYSNRLLVCQGMLAGFDLGAFSTLGTAPIKCKDKESPTIEGYVYLGHALWWLEAYIIDLPPPMKLSCSNIRPLLVNILTVVFGACFWNL